MEGATREKRSAVCLSLLRKKPHGGVAEREKRRLKNRYQGRNPPWYKTPVERKRGDGDRQDPCDKWGGKKRVGKGESGVYSIKQTARGEGGGEHRKRGGWSSEEKVFRDLTSNSLRGKRFTGAQHHQLDITIYIGPKFDRKTGKG